LLVKQARSLPPFSSSSTPHNICIKHAMSSGAGGAVQQPYIPTDAEQAEHLQNLIRKLKEFWVEQLAEMESLSLATEQVRVCGCMRGCVDSA